MIGPALTALGLALLAAKDWVFLRRPGWRGEPLQWLGLLGLALFISGVLVTLRTRN